LDPSAYLPMNHPRIANALQSDKARPAQPMRVQTFAIGTIWHVEGTCRSCQTHRHTMETPPVAVDPDDRGREETYMNTTRIGYSNTVVGRLGRTTVFMLPSFPKEVELSNLLFLLDCEISNTADPLYRHGGHADHGRSRLLSCIEHQDQWRFRLLLSISRCSPPVPEG
jgi:hypothetical protein